MAIDNGSLRQIRCSQCGRFFGKGHIEEGELYLWCKKCKAWTAVLGENAESSLTGQDMRDKLLSGTKAREG